MIKHIRRKKEFHFDVEENDIHLHTRLIPAFLR